MMGSKLSQSRWTALFWIFPVLFLIDDVLGLNGYQFTVHGIGIRILLFCLSAASLGLYCVWAIVRSRMTIFRRKTGQPFFWDYWRTLDWFVLGFLVLNAVWATVIPVLVRGNMTYGVKDFTTLLVLVLYFPCVFLIRLGLLQEKKLMRWLYPLLVLLAVWHSVMYIGETLSPGFYAKYYDLIDKISLGTAVRSDVVEGYGVVRIIQVTSILMIPGAFLSVRKCLNREWFGAVGGAVTVFALLITYTKSIWFGCFGTLLAALLIAALLYKPRVLRRRAALLFAAVIVLVVGYNSLCLGNTVFTRALHHFSAGQSVSLQDQYDQLMEQIRQAQAKGLDVEDMLHEAMKLENQLKDAKGTTLSNDLRSAQKQALLEKWKGSKLLGYGYGAYSEEVIRNEQYPFMYEYMLPAMLMKLGIVGMMGWAVFLAAMVYYAWKKMGRHDAPAFVFWLADAGGVALAVQTNPFLFTFAGISIILWLCLQIDWAEQEHKGVLPV